MDEEIKTCENCEFRDICNTPESIIEQLEEAFPRDALASLDYLKTIIDQYLKLHGGEWDEDIEMLYNTVSKYFKDKAAANVCLN